MDKSSRSLVTKLSSARRVSACAGAVPLFFASLLSACAAALLLISSAPASAQPAADLELVIAVDVSLSMDLDEQRLQRDGYVAAFRDAEMHKAITLGGHGRIAVTYVEWAGPASQSIIIPWTTIDGSNAALAFADKLEAAPISRARLTSISSALRFSHDLFATSGVKGIRRVVDVSGDGPNNSGQPVAPVRDELVAHGIVINGLPIVLHAAVSMAFDIPDLDAYYGACVIGGAGAFMVPVRELKEFASAIRRKLLLEISGHDPPARLVPTQASPLPADYDCLVGEKRWQWYFDRIPN